MPPTSTKMLHIWKTTGQLLAKFSLPQKSFTIAANGDADFSVKELADCALFVTTKNFSYSIYQTSPSDSTPKTYEAKIGTPFLVKDLYFLFVEESSEVASISTVSGDGLNNKSSLNFVESIIAWSKSKEGQNQELNLLLASFLEIICQVTKAKNSFVVLNDKKTSRIISTFGISLDEALKSQEKLLQNINDDIIRAGTTMILPYELQGQSGSDTTIFVKGLQSIVGFPVIQGQKVLAIIYLSFTNLLKDLAPEVQNALERIAGLLGLVIGSALLREELKETKEKMGREELTGLKTRMIAGNSAVIDKVYKQIEKIASINIPVLISGETGTGKELTAKEIHNYSSRNQKGFIPINCAAIPENLVEGVLFGYKKGAFTGAITDTAGLIEQAHGGTLFLDEIADLPLGLQVKLLRVLQDKLVRRVGDLKEIPVDFRLVCASHKDLSVLVAENKFRQDLYYRVVGASIHLPPLREREDDVLLLAELFKKRFSEMHQLELKQWSKAAKETLKAYSWPGNIRELEHVVSRAVIMSEELFIGADDLGLNIALDHTHSHTHNPTQNQTHTHTVINQAHADFILGDEPLEEAKNRWLKQYLIAALEKQHGSRTETAKILGIGERTLFRYLEQLKIKN